MAERLGIQDAKGELLTMKLIRSITVLIMGGMLVFLTGCASLAGDDPREMLSQTVSSVIGEDDFAFHGTAGLRISEAQLNRDFAFSGYVAGHNEIYIEPRSEAPEHRQMNGVKPLSGKLYYAKVNKQWTTENGSEKQLNPLYTWNPLIQLEHLNRVAGKADVERGSAANGQTVLHAVVREEELLELVKKQIRHEHETVIAAARERASSTGNESLQAQLAEYVRQAEEELDEILGSLQITSDYELFLTTRSRKLREMNVQARLEYELDGKRKAETVVKTYEFVGQNGR